MTSIPTPATSSTTTPTTGSLACVVIGNGIRRREQIVAKASEVFGELGYVGGSLRTIAERVGVTPASLLQYFGSKEGLLEGRRRSRMTAAVRSHCGSSGTLG